MVRNTDVFHIFVLFFFRINFEFFSSGNVVSGSICLSFILLKNVCNFILSFFFFSNLKAINTFSNNDNSMMESNCYL